MANFTRAKEQGQVGYNEIVSPLDPRVVVGSKIENGRSKKVVARLFQSTTAGVNRSYYSIPISPAPASSSFTGTNIYQYNLLPGTITDCVKSMRLLFQFQNTSGSQAVTISPINMGLQRIEIYSGQNDLLNTIYDTDIMIRWNLMLKKYEWEMMSYNCGYTTSWAPNTTQLNLGTNAYLNVSFPVFSIFDAADIHFENILDSILIKFYFRSAVSSGTGVLALQNASYVFDVAQDSDMYRKEVVNLYANNILKTNYLDCFNVSSSYTLTAGQTTKISLQNIVYKVPFFVFCIRQTINCTNNNMNNFASLGNITDSTQFNIQVQNPASYDILNQGQGVGPSDMQLINALYLDNNLFNSQNLYFVPFTTSVKRSLVGDQSAGFYYFDGSLFNLALLPGNNFSSGTYTVDLYIYYFRALEISNGRIKSCSY